MVIAFAVLLALLAVGAAGLVVLNLLAIEPPWLAGTRHSLAEARYRAAGVLAEFADWLRIGR